MPESENEEVQIQTLKKPITGYIHFCNDVRKSVKDGNNTLSPKEILTKLGELWQEIKREGGDEYKKYLKIAEDDKLRYNKEKEDNPNIKEKPRKKRESKKNIAKDSEEKKTKDKKDDRKEPRQLNGYLKYLQAKRDGLKTENPEFTSKKITSELAAKWRELSDEDKQHWKNS